MQAKAPEAEAPEAEAAEAKAPEPALEMQPPAPQSASEEAASALERAIAALRAGHVPTSSPLTETQFAPIPIQEFMTEPTPEPEPAPEPELSLTEYEVEVIGRASCRERVCNDV